MTTPHYVKQDRRDAVEWLTIDRADKANALLADTMAELTRALAAAVADDAVRAIVLTGAGTRAFSGGVDFRTQTELPKAEAQKQRSQRFFELLLALAECPKPVIAGVNGAAIGGGAMLAWVCDRIVASESAVFSLPEVDLGGPTYPAIAILVHTCGAGIATDLVQTGRRMAASEAARYGLVHEMATAAELAERVQQAAQSLAAKPARAVALNKAWMRRPLIEALHASHDDMAAMRAAGAH